MLGNRKFYKSTNYKSDGYGITRSKTQDLLPLRQVKERKCNQCDKKFISESFNHRRCEKCKVRLSDIYFDNVAEIMAQ